MGRWISTAVLGTVVAVGAGCAAKGADYARPQMPTPDHYRFADDPAQAEMLVDMAWWQVFRDPDLQVLIREALTNNLDLRAAAARVERARAEAGIARSFLYPQLDAVLDYSVRDHTDEQLQQSATYGGQLTWEVDLFGRLRRQTEAAYARFLASDSARRGVLVALVGNVASNYFLLRQREDELNIALQTL